MNPLARAWTEGEKATLRLLWADASTTATTIAEQLPGRNRNAVIGKAHALGLGDKPAKPRPPVPVRTGSEPRRAGDKRVRKAYASKGDDCTLSRFVKIKGAAPHVRPKSMRLPGLANPSVEAGRSIFHRRGITPAGQGRVLVSGHSNVKIGRDVRKGSLRGYWIYTLTLEERATCPRTCFHWQTCYGNGMPYAKRVDHRDQVALKLAIERDVELELGRRGRVGILVRLHALGDFFDPRYVVFWSGLLDRHPRLAVYGYTAWAPDSPIGAAIVAAKTRHGARFAIRWSNGGLDADCAMPVRSVDAAVNAIVCPEQTGRTAACATCGLCWGTTRNIAFLEH